MDLYVLDTSALISYFNNIFNKKPTISDYALKLIGDCINTYNDNIRLSIPSIVFIEIYEKWCLTEEFARKIRYEIFLPVFEHNNIEIREIDKEVLENLINLDDRVVNLENHDKLVLSSAMVLQAPLITSDSKIRRYVTKYKVINKVIT